MSRIDVLCEALGGKRSTKIVCEPSNLLDTVQPDRHAAPASSHAWDLVATTRGLEVFVEGS